MTTDASESSASAADDTQAGAPSRRGGPLGAIEWLWARVGFLCVLFGALAYCIDRMETGSPPEQAILLPLVATYLLVATLERVLYWRRAWLHSRGDLSVDFGHLLVSGIFANQLVSIPVLYLAIVVAGHLADAMGGGLWPTEWNLWVQLPFALVFGEFFLYWVHRLTHEVDFLWRFHAVHHSAPRLYFLNAARFHPVDLLLSSLSPAVALILVGADARIIALHSLFSAVHGLFQHANLPIRVGPLNWFFSLAELHRWHHSRVLEEANSNYGQNLIVWDIVFGTRFLPKDREPPEEIGLAGLDAFPMDYWGQLLSPIRWRSILAANADPGRTPSEVVSGAPPSHP